MEEELGFLAVCPSGDCLEAGVFVSNALSEFVGENPVYIWETSDKNLMVVLCANKYDQIITDIQNGSDALPPELRGLTISENSLRIFIERVRSGNMDRGRLQAIET
jgi:hypothetical protein